MNTKDSQSRKWLLTINNPEAHKLSHAEIIRRVQLSNPEYFCLVDEIATTGTKHTHVFIYSRSPIRFSTLENRFPAVHCDRVQGSVLDNRNYLRKEGKWLGTQKAETNLIDTFEEYGNIPDPCAESSPDMADIISDIENGMSTYDIIKLYPKYGFKVNNIETIRQVYLREKYSDQMRRIKVTYIWGTTGTGKTRGIFEKHHPSQICRITAYKNGVPNFDAYSGQPVLVFEEFASQVPIEFMLNYLDIYPVMLPARYADKFACYTTVYITSNLPLEQQYMDEQKNKSETWGALRRRINTVMHYTNFNEFSVTELNPVVVLDKGGGEL
ncbi:MULTISPECIES: viral replication protein [unclassified Ruminococcus]|uniref:viral replication protein n=1 Tax=unclassified Ruminococcus TaxID=2608920 RepID=UPI002108BDC0|nr:MULTISPECIES: viral replication protein [unclassified Ruminococcus]MCQ4021929.1 viral replication protein [Ruminococcus sp. zg-924]MCQ4115665.1 viral replication protein [Ruminococcus sp. zg-921]